MMTHQKFMLIFTKLIANIVQHDARLYINLLRAYPS
jgi:hypothetical protein